MVVIMLAIVIYDSFVHDLPFYYILFALGGMVLGWFFEMTRSMRIREEDKIITQEFGLVSVVFLIIILIFKLYAGERVFKNLNVVYFGDALYLFFIGFYFERVYNSKKQIDEVTLDFFRKKGQ